MKEETKQVKKVRSINRLGIGSMSLLQIVLIMVVFVAGNFLSNRYYYRRDLSKQQDYSLSSSTERYLKSEVLKERGKPVKLVMAYKRTSPMYERVRALVEEYQRVSSGWVKVELVDPMRSPDRMQEIVAAYGISLVRDLLIVDGRTDTSAVVTEDGEKVKTLNPHVKMMTQEELCLYTTQDGKRKISGFQGEDVITARIIEAVEGKPKKVALLTDKSRVDEGDKEAPHLMLEQVLRLQNVEFSPLQLSGTQEIPGDISSVLLIAPKYDFSDEEMAVLKNYWMRPKSSLLVMIANGECPPKLRVFLKEYGITVHKDRLVSVGKDGMVTRARGEFSRGIEFIQDLAGLSTEFGGASSSLRVKEADERLLDRKIVTMGLVKVQDGYWGETAFGKGGESYDEKDDYSQPLHMAACVIRGAENDDRFAAESSRMVVISNTDFLSPKHQSAENLDFIASATNWMVGREALAGTGPRSLGVYKLPLLDVQVAFLNRVNFIFMPGLLLLVGMLVWNSRRS